MSRAGVDARHTARNSRENRVIEGKPRFKLDIVREIDLAGVPLLSIGQPIAEILDWAR